MTFLPLVELDLEAAERVASTGVAPSAPTFTIGTLVTDPAQYDAMRQSLIAGGFSEADCEYLAIDNVCGAQIDAYRGLNAILNRARGAIVILCHQDVRLIDDDRAMLERRLAEITRIDPHWAVAGNAGGVAPGRLALRISDPHGRDRTVGTLPARVSALDENLLIIRRDARLAFSRDLTGFHFYGADICLHAAQLGYSAYVIDFHLEHLSPGRKSRDFEIAERAFRARWSKALHSRWVQTTCSLVHISGAPGRAALGPLFDRLAAKAMRRWPSAAGWTRPPRTIP